MEEEKKEGIKKSETDGEFVYGQFQCKHCGNEYKFENHSKFKKETMQFFMLEDVYYIRDPFEETSKIPMILGGNCSICSESVCISPKCSIFYTKRYCLSCLIENVHNFPEEIRKDISNLDNNVNKLLNK